METAIVTTMPVDEAAEFDRVCRREGVDRAEAVSAAIRWYVAMDGYLPSTDDPAADEF